MMKFDFMVQTRDTAIITVARSVARTELSRRMANNC